jgi:hypothetical protein
MIQRAKTWIAPFIVVNLRGEIQQPPCRARTRDETLQFHALTIERPLAHLPADVHEMS